MFYNNETKIEKGVKYSVKYDQDLITVFAKNLKTGRNKMVEYHCDYNYFTGYKDEDVIEVYRIVDDLVKELIKNEKSVRCLS